MKQIGRIFTAGPMGYVPETDRPQAPSLEDRVAALEKRIAELEAQHPTFDQMMAEIRPPSLVFKERLAKAIKGMNVRAAADDFYSRAPRRPNKEADDER